jgi:antitoxin YefM
MQAVAFNEAIQNFDTLMDNVSENCEPLIITRENHKSVVMMNIEDFNAWQETAYLMRSPANAKDLLEAVEDIKNRKNLLKKDLIEVS